MSTTVVSDMSFRLGDDSFDLGGGRRVLLVVVVVLSCRLLLHLRVPLYFPLAGGINSSTTLYPFDTSIDHMSSFCHQVRPKLMHPGIGIHPAGGDHDQVMKMEENQELNLMSRQFLGLHGNDHRYWCGVGDGSPGGGSGGSWPDMSGVNASCSTSHVFIQTGRKLRSAAMTMVDHGASSDREASCVFFHHCSFKIHVNLGVALEGQGMLLSACEHYREAAILYPTHYRALKLLGSALLGVGENRAAVKALEEAIIIKSDFADAHCDLASPLHALGDDERAVVEFQKAIDLQPGSDTTCRRTLRGNFYIE
ncbi:hypothetical protein Dimus_007303 [Dionaea muscipula]